MNRNDLFALAAWQSAPMLVLSNFVLLNLCIAIVSSAWDAACDEIDEDPRSSAWHVIEDEATARKRASCTRAAAAR